MKKAYYNKKNVAPDMKELEVLIDQLSQKYNLKVKKFLENNIFILENNIEFWSVIFNSNLIFLYHQNEKDFLCGKFTKHPQLVRDFSRDAVEYFFEYVQQHYDYKIGKRYQKSRLETLLEEVACAKH